MFSDVVLPGQVDGLALARTLAQCYPHIPVVLTTGYTRVFEANPEFPVLRKPYQISTLGRASDPAVSGHCSALNNEFLTEIIDSNKRIPK